MWRWLLIQFLRSTSEVVLLLRRYASKRKSRGCCCRTLPTSLFVLIGQGYRRCIHHRIIRTKNARWSWERQIQIFLSDSDLAGADPGFGQGGAPGSEAKSCRCSKVESREQSKQFVARVQGPLKGPGSFWVFNAQICILPHSRDTFSLIFDIYFNTKSW